MEVASWADEPQNEQRITESPERRSLMAEDGQEKE